MQPVRDDILPILGCYNVGDGIGIIVPYHFWHPGSAGGKIEQHGISGRCFHPLEGFRLFFEFFHKIQPSRTASMNTDFDRNGGGVRHGGFRMFQSIPVGGTDNPLDMGGIKAVYKIFFGCLLYTSRCV